MHQRAQRVVGIDEPLQLLLQHRQALGERHHRASALHEGARCLVVGIVDTVVFDVRTEAIDRLVACLVLEAEPRVALGRRSGLHLTPQLEQDRRRQPEPIEPRARLDRLANPPVAVLHGHLRVEDWMPVVEFLDQADHLAAVAGVLDTKQRVVETMQMHPAGEPAGQIGYLPVAARGLQHVGLDQLAARVGVLDVRRGRHGMALQVVDELAAALQPRQVSNMVGHGRQRRPGTARTPQIHAPAAATHRPCRSMAIAFDGRRAHSSAQSQPRQPISDSFADRNSTTRDARAALRLPGNVRMPTS